MRFNDDFLAPGGEVVLRVRIGRVRADVNGDGCLDAEAVARERGDDGGPGDGVESEGGDDVLWIGAAQAGPIIVSVKMAITLSNVTD